MSTIALRNAAEGAALRSFLVPLAALLDREDVTELSINRPQQVFIDGAQGIQSLPIPELTFDHLMRLASLMAYETNQIVDAQHPLLSAWLPGGQRVQVVLPPACESGTVVMSIRRHVQRQFDLDDLDAAGLFQSVVIADQTSAVDDDPEPRAGRRLLRQLLQQRQIKAFLRAAVKLRRNIVVSGATGSGKTTFLNALLREVPQEERLVTIEDVRELHLAVPNRAHLLASKGRQGVATVGIQDLLEASLRLRPDRIILGELRGGEAASFLHAINSGHPGSLTSVHADSPALAFERLALMVLQGNPTLTHAQVLAYLRNTIDIVVQLGRAGTQRCITQLYYRHAADGL